MINESDMELSERIKYLAKKMEKALDFGYDDEEVELSNLLGKKGLSWKWEKTFRNPQVIIYKKSYYIPEPFGLPFELTQKDTFRKVKRNGD